MNNDTPFTATGDEALEARIVAWVAGEASAFEAAELERLCAERSELEVFRRRMLAMEMLLKGAASHAPSGDWKLPAEKRAKIEELAELETPRPSRIGGKRKSSRVWIPSLATAALLLLGFFLSKFWVIRVIPPLAEKTVDFMPSGGGGGFSASREKQTARLGPAALPRVSVKGAKSEIVLPAADEPSSLSSLGSLSGGMSRDPIGGAGASGGRGDGMGRGFGNGTGPGNSAAVPSAAAASESFAGRQMELALNEDKPADVANAPATPPPVAGPASMELAGEKKADRQIASGKDFEGFIHYGSPVQGQPEMPAKPSAGEETADLITSADQRPKERDAASLARKDNIVRSRPALAADDDRKVDQVRRSLYQAEGNYNLGKYDDARRSYEDTLRVDPYNAAARRGMERVLQAKSDYYRAAYDHTRAELLKNVDATWEGQEAQGQIAAGSDLAKSISDQEEKVKERRKNLSAIARTKGSIFQDDRRQPDERETKPAAPFSPPPQPAPPPTDEVSAADEPFSTFSLNVSDASFQIARAALAKGEQPDPASIKVEQFYNAVDYGDPAPAAGEPVAVKVEQVAHPVIPGRTLVRVAARVGAEGRTGKPLRLTLLVDQSGSMVREDRKAAFDAAMDGLKKLLTARDSVTVIGFARTPRLVAENVPGDQAGKLAAMIHQEASEGGTNLEEAMKAALEKSSSALSADAVSRIVLFTDGAANLGDADPDRLADVVKIMRQKGIGFDVAGIGADELNDRLLGELARHGNGRYQVVDAGGADQFAHKLAGAFRPAAENVKVQVKFNPARVARYKLIGFEKDRLKKEDFRNDAVDAAELAAEETGVAIYQVETLPDGNGEIGEVFVRFRDTADGQMVERSWSLPYETRVPALDQAAPSMRLAVLAMLAGEKLKGGPLAEAIDFRELRKVMESVRAEYRSSTKAAAMLEMTEHLQK